LPFHIIKFLGNEYYFLIKILEKLIRLEGITDLGVAIEEGVASTSTGFNNIRFCCGALDQLPEPQ
jgi:hypothetical protein